MSGSLARSRQGANAKAFGSLFEKLFLTTCRGNGIAVTKIPDGCKQVGRGGVIRVRTPWDWILTYNSRTAFIDTKTTHDAQFACSAIVEHQVLELSSHERAGALAGYVIWLRQTNRVFFMPASRLLFLMQAGGSFNEAHSAAIFLGTDQFDVRP